MTLKSELHSIVDIARYAPSVHNTQPWQVQLIDESALRIDLNRRYLLDEGDPTGRQTVISMGIFVEAIAIAANGKSLELHSVELTDNGAILRFTATSTVQDISGFVSLLRRRCTDRSIYKPTKLDAPSIERLETIPESSGITTKVITDPSLIETIADLTAKGIGVALSNPNFRKELSNYLVLPWSAKRRGIAVRSLYLPWLLEVVEPFVMRMGLGLNKETVLEKKRWLSASGIAVILADGDIPKYWLEVGRTYLRLSLEAEALGLSQATSAAIVEASNYHEDIEAALGTNQRILALIRLGKGSKNRHYSPRVSVNELLT